MKSDFDFDDVDRFGMESDYLDSLESANDTPPLTQSEREFELISAYVDGEVTLEERREVQHLLDTNPDANRLYASLLRLHYSVDQVPVPNPTPSTPDWSEEIFKKVDRRRRTNQLIYAGGVALTTVVIGAIMTILPANKAPLGQFAQSPLPKVEQTPETLMIAVNHPVVTIPAAAQYKPKK